MLVLFCFAPGRFNYWNCYEFVLLEDNQNQSTRIPVPLRDGFYFYWNRDGKGQTWRMQIISRSPLLCFLGWNSCSKRFVFFLCSVPSIITITDRRRTCVFLWCTPPNMGFPRSRCTCTRAVNCRWTLWLCFCACRFRRSFRPPSRISVGIPPGCFPGGRHKRMPRWKADRGIPDRCGRLQRGPMTTTTDHPISSVALDGFQRYYAEGSWIMRSAHRQSIQMFCPDRFPSPRSKTETTAQPSMSTKANVGSYRHVSSLCFVVDPTVRKRILVLYCCRRRILWEGVDNKKVEYCAAIIIVRMMLV